MLCNAGTVDGMHWYSCWWTMLGRVHESAELHFECTRAKISTNQAVLRKAVGRCQR
jgi:hypothetical protein